MLNCNLLREAYAMVISVWNVIEVLRIILL